MPVLLLGIAGVTFIGLIVSANPVFTAVPAALFLHEPLTSRKVAERLLSYARRLLSLAEEARDVLARPAWD
jgi:hypothetical protein